MTHALLVALVAAVVLLLTAPGLAQAVTTVTATESGTRLSLNLAGDGTDSAITVTGTSTDVVISGVNLDSTADDGGSNMCTGTDPVTCDWTTDEVGITATLGGGDDRLDVSNLDDLLVYSNLQGEGGNDTINGASGDDQLSGGPGIDALNGLEGDDTLNGGPGADEFRGASGDDWLILDDGEADAPGSDCGSGDDYLQNDSLDPTVTGCEDQAYYPPTGGGTTPSRPTRPIRPASPPTAAPFTIAAFSSTGAKGELTLSAPRGGMFLVAQAPGTGKALIKPTSKSVTRTGGFDLLLYLTSAGKKAQKKRKLRVKIQITYTPSNGAAVQVKQSTVTFKKAKKKSSTRVAP